MSALELMIWSKRRNRAHGGKACERMYPVLASPRGVMRGLGSQQALAGRTELDAPDVYTQGMSRAQAS